ncbi:hypothetical protein ACSVDM_18805 [Nocardia sp. JW2]|uniref:Uncharacterized protein n=1 Tax=Nocardia coubleae TaxID=356147 RepID=A0A846W1R7_9NOCA|nr:hypothetical protein [Nocardia coubleae]NKX87081.1 hypothetical protein [Nocardia coubleae]
MGSRYTDSVSAWREQVRKDLRTVTEFAQEARAAATVRGRGIGRVADGARRDVTAEARALAEDLADLADAALRSRTDGRKSRLGNLFGSRARRRR